jgi:hypothetical protein
VHMCTYIIFFRFYTLDSLALIGFLLRKILRGKLFFYDNIIPLYIIIFFAILSKLAK